MSNSTGVLYTISAPSGAGKTSLVKAALERSENLQVSVSHTTRPRRDGERDGINYHFTQADRFEAILEQGGFLEHARVFDNWYGTSQQWVEDTLRAGIDVILEIDWQGAQQVRRLMSATVSIFILPPSRQTLLSRLRERGQDDSEIIAARMAQATAEMSHYTEADYLIINDVFDDALADLLSVIRAGRLRLERQSDCRVDLIKELLS